MGRRDPHPQRARADPEAQGRLERHRLAVDSGRNRPVRIDLEFRGGPLAPGLAAARSGRGRWAAGHGDPERPCVDPGARAGADRAAEPVAVVGDQKGALPDALPLALWPGPGQVQPLAVRAEGVGHRVQDRPDLRVAVLVALHRLGVEPQRDVVDEDSAVDLGQVHAALAALGKRVERADDVVAVDPEIESEVVAGAGGNAGVGQVQLGGDAMRLSPETRRHRPSPARRRRPQPRP